MKTCIIKTERDFLDYFHILKKSASLDTTPNVYMVGFDVEFISKSNFPDSHALSSSWVSTVGEIVACTIQIATSDICMLINLVELKNNIHKQIYNIITNPSWLKVGIGIDTDLKVLSDNYNLGHCGGGLELRNFGIIAGIQTPNLEYMYNTITGDNVKKSCSICDWSQPLSKKQIAYAAKDALMSYVVARHMLKPMIKYLQTAKPNNNTKTSTSLVDIDILNHKPKNLPVQVNYVGKLQEYAQKNAIDLPIYKEDTEYKEKGYCMICMFSDAKTSGIGRSKKEAKRNSAKIMCENIKI